MMNENRQVILRKIKASISTHGYHVTLVQGGPDPRFAYTVGLHEKVGFELVFAGGSFFTSDEVLSVVNEFAGRIVSNENSTSSSVQVEGLGSMSLREVDPSWGHRMLLGVLDFYGLKQINAFQISPDREHWTIDIPNMKEPWSPATQPIWKWLETEWAYPVPSESKAITNLDALRGRAITELMRWDEGEWEMFAGAGPDVHEGDLRIVPLGTMLGHDATLECVVNLDIGSGLWRDDLGLEWHPWGNRKS